MIYKKADLLLFCCYCLELSMENTLSDVIVSGCVAFKCRLSISGFLSLVSDMLVCLAVDLGCC